MKEHSTAFRIKDPLLEQLLREQIALEHIRILDAGSGSVSRSPLMTEVAGVR